MNNQDDPEKRIADLECQLAEQKRGGADRPPASPDHPAAPRRFIAATSQMKTSIYIVGYAAVAACLAPFIPMMFQVPFALAKTTGWMVVILVWVGVGVFGTLAIRRLGIYKKIPISVTSDGLIVDRRPGDVFTFNDAKLGLWTLSGTALHLRCGRHRFVLGGEDHRVGAATRLDAPPTGHVDGWLPAGDFDDVLTMVARRSGLDIRGPAPGEPLRCLLFPRSSAGILDFGLKKLNPKPSLAVDVGTDAVWLIDPNTNALIVKASLAQVTATPANCKYNSEGGSYTVAVLVVRVPGLQPLTIDGPRSCAWRGKVPEEKEPEFMVSDADWQVLVEKFGLAPNLVSS